MKKYSIEIDSNGILVDADEFLEFKRLEYFDDFDTNTQEAGDGIPSTLEKGIAKAKGYEINNQLLKDMSALCTILLVDQDYSDGMESTLDTMAEKIRYLIQFDNDENLTTEDELNPDVFLEGGDCIKRMVARSLAYNRDRSILHVYDPTINDVNNNPPGFRLLQVDIPSFFDGVTFNDRIANIEANITIDEILEYTKVSVIANGGTGYAVNDILTVSGGTFNSPAKIKVVAVNDTGVIIRAELYYAGLYYVLPANAVSVTGGAGNNDATFTLV